MDLYTNCFIPSLGEEIRVNSVRFGDLFELNSYFNNMDYDGANTILEKICDRSLDGSDGYTNLDKFALLVHNKNEFLDKILTLSAKDENSKKISYEIILSDIVEVCKKYEINNFNLPSKLYYKDVDEILEETGKSIDEIKDHINQNKILMFGVPDFIKGIPNVYMNCFDNTFFYFCKLLYNTNLTVFYKKIKKYIHS